MTQLEGEPSSKVGMMLQQLLEDMRDMKGKLEDVDRRVRTQEIAKQSLEIFNPSGQNDEGSSKTPLDATPSHLIVQDTLSPNIRTIIALNDGGYQTEDKSKDDHREDDSSDEFMGEGDGEEINDDGKLVLVVRRNENSFEAMKGEEELDKVEEEAERKKERKVELSPQHNPSEEDANIEGGGEYR
ncbi:hypothetical protein H5410_020657 [Solanum commersonii]|uniref:Uncharacterized protein n=1 Tax=Solanum commersonii TaxID=4109 RepID=A0A9J5ZBX8_SOLCO|nr:hypothetical protein H5410_020657 [Solanum commersonii]